MHPFSLIYYEMHVDLKMYNWSFYGVKVVVCSFFLNSHNFQIYKGHILIFVVYYNQPVVIVFAPIQIMR